MEHFTTIEIGCLAIAAFVMAFGEALRREPRVWAYIPFKRFFRSRNWRFVPAVFVTLAAILWGSSFLPAPKPSSGMFASAPASTPSPEVAASIRAAQEASEKEKKDLLGLGRVKTRGETQDLATNGAPVLPVRLCPDRCNERLDAHDVHHAGNVVGQHMQCHFGSNLRQALHQEVRRPHSHF